MVDDQPTQGVRGEAMFVRRFEVAVVAGADVGVVAASDGDRLSIGTADGNGLRLTDPSVSRHHCTLRTHERGLELRDHASRNGTFVGDAEVVRGFVRSGARLVLGHSQLVVRVLDGEIAQPIAPGDRLGAIVGASPVMRRLYAQIAATAATDATVLIAGETGTGKELVAEAIHDASARRRGPFVVVDCGALSHALAEAELFGHVRGAFTGADGERVGAFEAASGGTIFLDEVGELPLALQPLLLRALEARQVRRVGETAYRDVDVRVIAASHRDLRALVNDRQLRPDLFYRLHVLPIEVPPLRERGGDARLIAEQLWRTFRPDQPPPAGLVDELSARSWPGNVRELRNAVERAALLGWRPAGPAGAGAVSTTYQEAKAHALAAWEGTWARALVAAHGGNLSRAARAARMGRSHLRELVRAGRADAGDRDGDGGDGDDSDAG